MAALATTLVRLKLSSDDRKAVLWLILTVVLFFAPLFAGFFYGTGDMRTVFIPLESFFHSQQLAGHLPAWDPDVAWGFPVIAAAQIGFFYPPLLLTRWLPVFIYLPVVLITHFVALGIGMYCFLRSLRSTPTASFFGALCFTLSSFVLQHITHLNIVLAIAWLPWQLLAINKRAPKGLLALLFGIPFLAGQLQIPFMMAAVSSVYLVTQWRQYSLTRRFGVVMLLVILVGGLGAVQLLPTLELAGQSSRGVGGDFSLERANQHSWPVYHAPTLLFPYFFGNDATYWGKRLEIEYGFFIGTLPVALALWALWKRNWPHLFWPTLLGISFLLSLGGLSPFRLVGLEPSLWIFSAPARWLLFTSLVLSVLAARGLDALPTFPPRLFRIFLALGVVSVVTANVILFLIPLHSSIPKINQLLSYARYSSVSLLQPFTYIPLGIVATAVFLQRNARLRIVLVILTVIELLLVGWHVSPYVRWSTILSPPSTLSALPETVRSKQARVISERTGGDTGAYFTDPASRATATTRAQEKALLVPLVSAQFGILGVEWPASLDLKSQAAALAALRPEGSYEITNQPAAEALNIGAVLTPQTTGVIVHQYQPKPRVESTTGSVQVTEQTSSSVLIRVSNDAPGTLIVRDTLYPGWHATIDGASALISAYPPLFRALPVPAGQHTVRFSYQPSLIYVGIALSAVTMLACGVMLRFKI